MADAPSTAVLFDRLAGRLGGRGYTAFLIVAAVFSVMLFSARADIFTLPASIGEAGKEDFIAFWRAAELMLQGDAARAYEPVLFREGLAPEAQGLLFLNPPQFFLLIWPFGLFSYGVAKAFWIGFNLAALAGIAFLAGTDRGQRLAFTPFIILSPAAFAAFLPMQVSPVIAAGLLAALLTAKDRPILSGFIFALLTAKPQYALLAPVFLAACGEWKAFAAAAVFSAAFAGLSALTLGIEPWRAFFTALGSEHIPHASAQMRDALTLHQTVGKLGGGPALKLVVQLGATLLCGWAVWTTARKWRREAAAGFAIIASTFISPSLWAYDWPLFAAGLSLLARANGRWPLPLQIAASLLWIAPLISIGFGTMASSLVAPAIGAVMIVTLYMSETAFLKTGYSTSNGASSGSSG